jgi:hypothetical protein
LKTYQFVMHENGWMGIKEIMKEKMTAAEY